MHVFLECRSNRGYHNIYIIIPNAQLDKHAFLVT